MSRIGVVRFVLSFLCAAALLTADLRFGAFDESREQLSLAVMPFRIVGEAPSRMTEAIVDYFSSRTRLLKEKRELEEQLLQQSVRISSLDFFVQQNRHLRHLLDLRERAPSAWLAADLRREISRLRQDRIYINRGVNDGAIPGMAVVDERGVVGQIVRADGVGGAVNLIISHDHWLATRVRRTGQFAIVRGGGGVLEIYSMPSNSDLRAGDELVADGGVYPPGYPVGTVTEVARGVRYLTARVEPASNLHGRRTLLVYTAGGEGTP